jgi:RND family efflux transporter MFP subunit
MNNKSSTIKHAQAGSRRVRICLALAITAWLVNNAAPASASQLDGFTEPYRTVNVGTAEVGIIESLDVREGDVVKQGQVLAVLDSDVYEAIVAIAAEQMKARGRLESAEAELQLRQSRLAKLVELRENGHARQEEVERARTDAAISEAQVLAAKEELLVRKLEHDKALVQLERRTIRAPLDGVITKSHKQLGEFVAPNDPYLFTLVQLHPLLATFSVPSTEVSGLRLDQKVIVTIVGNDIRVNGVVELVSPVTDAESGTVRVKVRIDNPQGSYRSGERCLLLVPSAPKTVSR